MLEVLLVIILIIILITLLLGIKISLTYAKSDENFKGHLKILILKRINIYTLEFPSNDNDDEKKDNENEKDYKKISNLIKPCIKDLINYLKRILKTMKITKIQNHIIFGLDDFADTGKYIGIIWAILSIINQFDENMKLSAEPSFSGFKLNGHGENNVEIYPLKLIIPTIQLILKKNIRKMIKGIINERQKNNKKNRI